MRRIFWLILLVAATRAQYKICAPNDAKRGTTCLAVQKGDSKVSCLYVEDSAECAIKLASGEADFGIFNGEELLLAYQFYPSAIEPIIQLRHNDNLNDEYEFQTVVVIRADLTQKETVPGTGLDLLKNADFCHPGFSKSQRWNDYILKYFEKKVYHPHCLENATVAESEINSLVNFFGKACRPGEWVPDDEVDKELKKKYPQLCALCDDQATCKYNNENHHGHAGALECLISGRGSVAYAAHSYVQQILGRNNTYEFLCPNGDTRPLSTDSPCSWLRQPWSVVAARSNIADTLKEELMGWLNMQSQQDEWKETLSTIIQQEGHIFKIPTKMSLTKYLSQGREIDFKNSDICANRTIRWCTIGDLETNKCEWMAKAAIALGVEPRITCVKTNSTFQCLYKIKEKRTDIMTIDSNYGHLARTVYGLSTILYSETETKRNSITLAVLREPEDENYPIKSFYDLKGRTACFSEYGGISWLSFMVAARGSVISSKSCDYPLLMSQLLSGACLPGIVDGDHTLQAASDDVSTNLCSTCMRQNNTSCASDESNRYYGDVGAMRCLDEGAGDIAFVEITNIEDNIINPNKYRVLCKNGSLAKDVGFLVDENCALSVTIDSEVIGRKNDLQTKDIVLSLLKLENWLGYRMNARRPIHIYDRFNGTSDLLFKDSTAGLLPITSPKQSVMAYKKLFSHIDKCSNNSFAITANYIFVALVALYHFILAH